MSENIRSDKIRITHADDEASRGEPDPVAPTHGEGVIMSARKAPNPIPTIEEKLKAINRIYATVNICGLLYDPGYALMIIDSHEFEIVAAECLAEEQADAEAKAEERKVNVDEKPEADNGIRS